MPGIGLAVSPAFGTATASALGQGVGSSGPRTDANVTSINSEAWSVAYSSPPTFDPVNNPKYVVASRPGFDASGNAKTYTENFIITQRVRQAYPNQASLDASRCALTDYIYSTDTVSGVTNNSAETSPKPIVNWVMPHRAVVGNSLTLELVVAHRNARSGKEVASAIFRATDGTNTVTATVSTPAISGRTGDKHSVITYSATLDITSLTAGLITANAKVYPWIGQSASVLDSADQSGGREFSPRYFLKNTTLAASPPYAYVSTAGNDGTGVVSTTEATAKATPFLTVLGAINGIHTALSATTGVDGAIIEIGNDGGTPFVLGSTAATRTQKCGYLTITRDPTVARANARVSFGAANFRTRLGGSLLAPLATGALRFNDIQIVRTGTGNFQGEAATFLEVIFDDVDMDNGSNAAAWLSSAYDYIYGMTLTNAAVSPQPLNASTTPEHRIIRGLQATLTTTTGIEAWCLIGSTITACPAFNRAAARSWSGAIVAFNSFVGIYSGGAFANYGTDADVTGVAILQNVFETISATSAPALGISHDNMTGSNSHIVLHHNTFVGFFNNGRSNIFYDEGTTPRTSKLMSMVGNIHVAINTKGDVFVTDGSRVGNWAYLYGVGCRGEFSQFIDANSGGLGTSFAQAYAGLKAKIGTSNSVRQDPLFTNYQGTTSGPTAGAGGGTYSITTGSPCENMVVDPVLNFDFAGNARPAANDAAGAYKAA